MKQPIDEKSFVELIEKYQNILHKVCSVYCAVKADREDLFQEIVLQVWRAYPSFKGQSKLSSWLYRVALNTAIARFRKQKRRIQASPLAFEQLNVPNETSHNEVIDTQRWYLNEAIKQLNTVERAIMVLYLEEHSYKEISSIMGISETNVGVKINRIKNKLRNLVAMKK